MQNGIRGLKRVGSDGHGIPILSGDLCPFPVAVFLFIAGSLIFVIPMWAILGNHIAPRLWVPPWDQYPWDLLVAARGMVGVLASIKQFRIRKQMKTMRSARDLAKLIGISGDELGKKLEASDYWPELNVNGTYYWNVSKLPLPDLLLHIVENPKRQRTF
jgi:hypothetical protein